MTFVIAEAGVNHNGDLGQAILLCNAAKECGADAVKFQHFHDLRPEIAHLEMSDAEMANIAWHCKAVGIEFMCTPFGLPEVAFLAPLVRRWKVASGCLADLPLLRAVAATGLPVVLSTGMNGLAGVHDALMGLGWRDDRTLLHCTSAYPCPIADVNLSAMDTLRRQFKLPVGYSDHTHGITIAIAAVARGATVLEKHLTLDRNAEGPDHKSSIEPAEFRVMVSAIRTVETALGDGVKRRQPSEAATRRIWYGD